jgi:hypothetical protein
MCRPVDQEFRWPSGRTLNNPNKRIGVGRQAREKRACGIASRQGSNMKPVFKIFKGECIMRNVLCSLLAVAGLVVATTAAHACPQIPLAPAVSTGSHIECVPNAPLALAAPAPLVQQYATQQYATQQYATVRQTVPIVSYATVEQQVPVATQTVTVPVVQASLRTRRLAELRAEHHDRRASAHLRRATQLRSRASLRACSTVSTVATTSAVATRSAAVQSACPPGTHPVLVPDGPSSLPVAPLPGPAPGDLQ